MNDGKSGYCLSILQSFCIELYKNAKHQSGNKAMEVLNGHNVLEFVQHDDQSHPMVNGRY